MREDSLLDHNGLSHQEWPDQEWPDQPTAARILGGRSCQTNILLCLERWTEMMDNGSGMDVAYFDYAEAFGKVSHRLLLVKLKGYGIDGKLLAWLRDYLVN